MSISTKRVFLTTDFRGKDTPDFEHTFSDCTDFGASGQFWLSSVQRARRVGDERIEEKKESWEKLSLPTTMSGSLIILLTNAYFNTKLTYRRQQ